MLAVVAAGSFLGNPVVRDVMLFTINDAMKFCGTPLKGHSLLK